MVQKANKKKNHYSNLITQNYLHKLYKLISNLYSQHAGRSESNKGGWQSENIISELPSFVDKIKPVVKEYMD